MSEQMPKKQHTIEYVAISVLVIAAFIIGIARFKKTDVDDEVFSRKEFNKKWKEVEILEAKVPKKEKEITYSVTEDEKIPFKSPFDETIESKEFEGEEVTLPVMSFQGMVWKSSRPQAIINNKIYDVNDIIQDVGEPEFKVKIKDVTKDGIHLIYKGKEFIVRPK